MLHLRCNVAFSQNFIRFAKSDNVVTMLFQKIAQRNVAFSTISHHFPEKCEICIFWILDNGAPSTCDIQKLSIIDYQYYGGKGDVRDLLSEILHILPNLRKLDIRYSRYFNKRNAIEKLIETRKDLEIRVTWQI